MAKPLQIQLTEISSTLAFILHVIDCALVILFLYLLVVSYVIYWTPFYTYLSIFSFIACFISFYSFNLYRSWRSSDLSKELKANRRKLLELSKEAEALVGKNDSKLLKATRLIQELVKEGFNPIVFCRFIHTAEYVAEHLAKALPKTVEVVSITGLLAPSDREARISDLQGDKQHVLVCTDCLSEGINLQEHFVLL